MSHDFTPRGVGEILDDAINLVKGNFRTIGPATAVILLPVAAAYSVVASFYMRTILEGIGAGIEGATGGPVSDPADFTFIIIALLMQGLGLLYMVSRAVLDATVYANSAQLLERRRVPLKEALRGGFHSFLKLIVIQFIASAASTSVVMVFIVIAVVLGLVLMIASEALGAFMVLVAYALAFAAWGVVSVLLSLAGPIVVIEGGIGQAIVRSFKLVRHHFWRVLLIIGASALLVTQFESAIAAPTIVREIITGVQSPGAVFSEIAWGWKVFDGVVQGVAIALVLPFAASVSLLTYLDLRSRDEGMDLVIRAQKLLQA